MNWSKVQCFILACLLVAGFASHADAEAPPARTAMLARGLNISHWLRFPTDPSDSGLRHYLVASDIEAIKKAGFTYVRVPIGLEVVMQGDHIAPNKLKVIVAIIQSLQQAKLAVVMDPHPQLVEHWNFAKNEEARRDLLGFWRDLAPALRTLPVDQTFPEIVNEPNSDAESWNEFQAQVLQVIRQALPENTIVLDGTDWSSINGLLKVKPVSDENVIYGFHTYEPNLLTLLGFWDPAIDKHDLAAHMPFPTSKSSCEAAIANTHQAHTRSIIQFWCSQLHNEATIASDLARATNWGRNHHVTVAMMEFGAVGILNKPARDAYFLATRQAANSLHLPWALWALDDQMGFDRPVDRTPVNFELPPQLVKDLGLGK